MGGIDGRGLLVYFFTHVSGRVNRKQMAAAGIAYLGGRDVCLGQYVRVADGRVRALVYIRREDRSGSAGIRGVG